MPRYYFNMINSTASVLDRHGKDLADLAAARDQAIADIRSVISDEARQGKIDLRGRIDILDDGGALVETVHYGQAFYLHTGATGG